MLIYGILITFLFNKVVFDDYSFQGGDSLSPKAIKQGIELAEEHYGEYPTWLPWVFSGLPSVHSFQNVSNYYVPNHIITFLHSLGMPWIWNFLFHFIFAGMGVFILLKELKTNTISAFLGGVTFMLMPYLVTMLVHGHGSQMMSTAYIPWVIWAILRLKSNPNILNMGLLTMFVGFQLQRAHVQIAYYTWLMIGLFILFEIILFIKNKDNDISYLKYLIPTLFIGIAMAMWIYYPVMQYTPHSIRGATGGGTGFDYATAWSFSIGEMMTWLIPSYFGFGGATYWGNMPFTDYPNYMGILPLVFAIIGVKHTKGNFKVWLLVSMMFALLLSFGHNFKFLYSLFYNYFPYFDKFRVPVMFLVLVQFGVAVFAGLGINYSFNSEFNTEKLKRFGFVSGSVFAFIWINKLFFVSNLNFGQRSHKILDPMRMEMIHSDILLSSVLIIITLLIGLALSKKWLTPSFSHFLIVGLIIVDLGIVNFKIIEPANDSYRQGTLKHNKFVNAYLSEDSVIKFLKSDTDKFRILPLGALANENRWSAFHLESVAGYHPAKISHYKTLLEDVGWNNLGVLQMMNVKYLVSPEKIEHPVFELVHTGSLFFQDAYNNTYVYLFKGFTPRAFYVETMTQVEDITGVAKLQNPQFNPIKDSFMYSELTHPINHSKLSTVKIVDWSPNKISLNIDAKSDEFIVLSEVFYPEGWKINDHPDIEIKRVNHVLRGFHISEGEYTLTMVFNPSDLRIGGWISWISICITFGLILFGILPKKYKESLLSTSNTFYNVN